MVWGGISWFHKTPLLVMERTLTARRYIDEILEPTVIPFLHNNADVTHYQQDNARSHSARITTAFLGDQNVTMLPCQAFSPDLSPTKHLWDQFGRRVFDGQRIILNKDQLIAALNEEWQAIP